MEKVVFVSTLSIVLTTFLVHAKSEVQKKFANFAYLYGSIATSSAPLVFSNEFTPHLSEDIASTIILGIILSGSSMFASSVIFAETANELDEVLKILVQFLLGCRSSVRRDLPRRVFLWKKVVFRSTCDYFCFVRTCHDMLHCAKQFSSRLGHGVQRSSGMKENGRAFSICKIG